MQITWQDLRIRQKWLSHSNIGFQLAYLHLTLTNSKGHGQSHGQGHAHLDDEYFGNGDIWSKNYYYHQIADSKSCMSFRLAYLHLALAYSYVDSQDQARFEHKSLGNGGRYGKHCNCYQLQSHILDFDIFVTDLNQFYWSQLWSTRNTFTPSAPSSPAGLGRCTRFGFCSGNGKNISGVRWGVFGVRGASLRALSEGSPGTSLNALNAEVLER